MDLNQDLCMGFSQEWEQLYKENMHMSIWPWSELISFVMRYSRPSNTNFRVLELGCGGGANIPFFISLGVNYYSIDGSATIIEKLKKKFPQIKNNLVVGDFTKAIPFDLDFDLIIDRGSVTCNSTNDIRNCLKHVHTKLKQNAKFIGIHWFSTSYSEYKNGIPLEDKYTKTGYTEGLLANMGKVHFSDKQHLLDLFRDFKIRVLEHKLIHTEIPKEDNVYATWNIVLQKN